MVEISNLVKEFNGFRALDGVNMSVKKSAIYGLVGPNGAGKSTLLRHLTGIYRQNSGTVKINGENAKPFAHSKDYLYFWQKYSD